MRAGVTDCQAVLPTSSRSLPPTCCRPAVMCSQEVLVAKGGRYILVRLLRCARCALRVGLHPARLSRC